MTADFLILLTANNGHMIPSRSASTLDEALETARAIVDSGKAWKASILDANEGGKVAEYRR